MKYFCKIIVFLACLFSFSISLRAQNTSGIDSYIGATAKLNTIGSIVDQLSVPQDLNFSPVPSRKNELWVVNKGDAGNGGSMVIFYNTGKSTQKSEYRHDSHSAHFMVYPTAFAMGATDSAYFATIGEALNSNGDNTSTFMGPVLWDSDTTKFARINQNNWISGQPLGSHIDMLHQSPYSMGIAFDTLNAYWVFDGYHSCLYHYNFESSHGYGGDDHSNGEILKYKEVKLKRIANLPSHMVVDRSTGWLYIVDNGNKRIIRINTRSGSLGNDITAPNEILQRYSEMVGVKWETVDSGFANLSGIDYFDGRLIVGNYGTGDIRVYNTTISPKPKYLGTIQTADAGMVGIRIGPDTAIYYVNRTKNMVVRLSPGGTAPVAATLLAPTNNANAITTPLNLTWNKTTGATTYHIQISMTPDFGTTLYDSTGIVGTSATLLNADNSMMYYWRVSAKNAIGEGNWSTVWHFKTIGAKPGKPMLMSPKDAIINIPLNPTLTWDAVTAVTGYNLQVSTWDMFATTVIDQSNIVNTTFTVSLLDPTTKYYWRVRALNDGAVGDWSDPRSFTTWNPASVHENKTLAPKLTINPIFPNPSTANAKISFTLAEAAHLSVVVVDLKGNDVLVLADGIFEIGDHTLNVNSLSIPTGMYLCKFTLAEGVMLESFVIAK